MKKVSLIVLLTTVALNTFCQHARLFTLQNQADYSITVDKTFLEDSELEPFTSNTISGLAVTGEIALYADSSLVRILLTDHNQNEYLIYETYPVLAGSRKVSVHEVAEETALLDNIIPFRVTIELVHASIHLKEITISKEAGVPEETEGDRLHQQSLNKIQRINQHIDQSGQKWVAGETSISRLSYQEKKSMFGGRVPNFQGFEYYVGGVFVLPREKYADPVLKDAKTETSSRKGSQYVKEYSWRNRHGEDWVTTVKNQKHCKSDWAFGATAAAELMTNLYYNQHLDYDLSEQQLVSCIEAWGCEGGSITSALEFIGGFGIVLENCFPYAAIEKNCSGGCWPPGEKIQIPGWTTIQWKDDFKAEIIKGATSAYITGWDQAIQIVGYKEIEAEDSLFVKHVDELWITIDPGDPLVGKTAWLCKNSLGEHWGDEGYVYLVGEVGDFLLYPYYGSVYSRDLEEADIVCIDRDGDGFYSWGAGLKPAHCPESPDEPDGDDSDQCIGPMNEYGFFRSTTPTPVANDTLVLYGEIVPDLYAAGTNIRWYEDRELTNLVHDTNWFTTGHTEPGEYTYYATQTFSNCESDPSAVTLSIVSEIPPPLANDTVTYVGEPAILTVTGAEGALFTWYEDPSLTVSLHTGDVFDTGIMDPGTYVYYVTQTLFMRESAPDTVILKVLSFVNTSLLIALIQEGVDINGDSQISIKEAETVASLNVAGYGITDMTGIEAFVNLDTLYCGDNAFTGLDVSGNSALKYLDCSGYLFMSITPLSTLDISGCSELTYLDCSSSRLTQLDLSGCTELSYLDCSYNQLNNLDLSANTALKYLYCANNSLKCLDISMNRFLGSEGEDYTELDLSYMPSLTEVCVWTTPFPPSGVEIHISGSPNVYFTADCSGCPTGMDQNIQPEVSVFPNPTHDFLTIYSMGSGDLTLEITSLNGQLIHSTDMDGPFVQLDLSAFRKGVYFITVRSKDFVTTKKIIKL